MSTLTLLVAATLMLAVIGGMIAMYLLNRSWGGSLDRTPAPPDPGSLDLAPPADDVALEARSLVVAGRTIEAVKLVRERSGLGLREAKEYVEALQDGVTPPFEPQPAPVPPEVEAEARALVAEGNMIEAVKLVRERTGLGLTEAKEYVEALR